MRAGYLRNKVYIFTYQTVSNGSGGTRYVYTESPFDIVNKYDVYCTSQGATVESNPNCTLNVIDEFTDYVYVWAEIKQKQGSRGVQGGKIDLDNYTEFRFRYYDVDSINKKWLLVFDNRTFTIHSYYVIDERKKEVIVNAVEVK